jgi:EspG family
VEFDGQRISRAAYDVLWESAMPGVAKPAVLHCGSPGRTGDERGRIVRDAWTELNRAGYAGPRVVSPEVAAVLDTVGRPKVAVDVRLYEWLPAGTRPARYGARVAVGDWRGACAVLGPDWYRAWSFPLGSLVDEVIRLFAHHDAPARFSSGFSMPPDHLALRPVRRGEDVLRLLEGPYLRRAHICVVARDPIGGVDRVSGSLVLNDVAAGRYLIFMARNEITIAPGRRGILERKLKDLLEPARQH